MTPHAAWGYGGGVTPADEVILAERGAELVGVVRLAQEGGATVLRGMQVRADERGRDITVMHRPAGA